MEPADYLSLIIEAGITITGFSGIVVALGPPRDRFRSAWDRHQFRGLLLSSLVAVAISGLALVLLAAELGPGLVWRIASATNLVAFALFLPSGLRKVFTEYPELISLRQKLLVFPLLFTVIVLLAANAIAIAAFWPLAVAVAFQIGISLVNFVQLLWRSLYNDHV